MAGAFRLTTSVILTLSLLGAGCASHSSGPGEADAASVAENTVRSLEVLAVSGIFARVALAVDPKSLSLSDDTATALSELAPCIEATTVSNRVSASFGKLGQPCFLGELALSGAIDMTEALVEETFQVTASVDPHLPLTVGGSAVLGAVILVRPPSFDSLVSELELLISQGKNEFISGSLSFYEDENGDLVVDGILTLDQQGNETSLLLSGLTFTLGARTPKAGSVSYDDGRRTANLVFREQARGVEIATILLHTQGSFAATFLASDLL